MKVLKKIVFGFLILIVVLSAVGLLLPRTYKVERSVIISAPIDLVFDQVNDLKKNDAWSPWKDPTMTVNFGSITAGKGASTSWESKKMGNGSQTIVESVPNESIQTDLDFGGKGSAVVHWTFAVAGEGVKVTQDMTGDQGMNPVKRYFGLMMNKMIGPYFERGMASLKQVSEAKYAEIKMQQAIASQDSAAAAETATPAAKSDKTSK